MGKWGCGKASRAVAVRTRKFREWQDRAEERLEEKRERELRREKICRDAQNAGEQEREKYGKTGKSAAGDKHMLGRSV